MENNIALIADDHQLFREGMESLLLKVPGIGKVMHASNGREVIELLDKVTPAIIFMDIRMPELNGVETTRIISKKNIPSRIIALTMMEDPHHVVSMFKAGAHGYLLKNTSFAELKEAIAAVRKGERYYAKDITHIILDRVTQNSPERPLANQNYDLTPRELEIVGLICRGFSNKDMADLLEISIRTIESHRGNIYEKLGVSNSVDLAVFALQENLVTNLGN